MFGALKPVFRTWLLLNLYECCWRRRTLNRKEQLRHRAVFLRQHSFLVYICFINCTGHWGNKIISLRALEPRYVMLCYVVAVSVVSRYTTQWAIYIDCVIHLFLYWLHLKVCLSLSDVYFVLCVVLWHRVCLRSVIKYMIKSLIMCFYWSDFSRISLRISLLCMGECYSARVLSG